MAEGGETGNAKLAHDPNKNANKGRPRRAFGMFHRCRLFLVPTPGVERIPRPSYLMRTAIRAKYPPPFYTFGVTRRSRFCFLIPAAIAFGQLALVIRDESWGTAQKYQKHIALTY